MPKIFWEMLKAEVHLFSREPFGMFFTLAFPVLLLLLFGEIFGGMDIGRGFHYADIYVSALFAMIIGNLSFMSLPITLAVYRELGIMKRLQVSPMPIQLFFAVQATVQAAVFFASALVLLAVSIPVFHIRFGGNPFSYLLMLLLSMGAFFGLGFALGGVLTSLRTTTAVGSAMFFLLFFTSGAAVPREQFPEWLRAITNYSPLAHVVDSLGGLWTGDTLGQHMYSILYLAAILVIAVIVTARTFRWQS
jgi:ABC-2 type transport system permease protein